MNKKQERILDIAIDVFTRYGVRRTTMGDIAERAGISRQTLYTSYANKDDILAAAVRHAADKTMAAITCAWQSAEGIGDRLDIYFQRAVVDYFELLRQMPDADDLLTGFSESGAAVIEAAEARKAEALASQLEPYAGKLEAAGMTVTDLADFIQSSSASFKYAARDKAHLKRLLKSLKTSVLTLIGEA